MFLVRYILNMPIMMIGIFSFVLNVCFGADTVEVKVTVRTEVSGVTSTVSTVTADAGVLHTATTVSVVKAGYCLSRWSISTKQAFNPRDAWGRLQEAPVFTPYEDTVLTAHYLPLTQDQDGDGISDCHEYYWYGDIVSATAATDSDQDGWTFAWELSMGMNPLFPNSEYNGLTNEESSLQLYNPYHYALLTVRSSPAGKLFATSKEYFIAGDVVQSAYTGNVDKTTFSYWTTNGIPLRDAWGRALEVAKFIMPKEDVELVAVTIDDEITRKLMHWYGKTDVDLSSDPDRDGHTLAWELSMGMNPLFSDCEINGVVDIMSSPVQYVGEGVHRYTIRSEPAGRLFATVSDYANVGDKITTPVCNPSTSQFAYWSINGIRISDPWGRAVESIVTNMPNEELELVADEKTIDPALCFGGLYGYGAGGV